MRIDCYLRVEEPRHGHGRLIILTWRTTLFIVVESNKGSSKLYKVDIK
jgi:hypothetical protein